MTGASDEATPTPSGAPASRTVGAERLAAAAERLRRELDAGRIGRAAAARKVAAHARAALRARPHDEALATTVRRLAEQGFVPPRPAELPPGSPEAVAVRIAALSEAERTELAGSVVAPPDPAAGPEEAARHLELLLATPGEHARARSLLEALAPYRPDEEVSLWRFRLEAAGLGAAERAEPETWRRLLERYPTTGRARARALSLAAAGLLEQAEAHGALWLVPVLGGLRVLHAAPARWRRPALGEALAPVMDWLDEATRLRGESPGGGAEGMDRELPFPEDRLARAERADTEGDPEGGTAALREAVERARPVARAEPGAEAWDEQPASGPEAGGAPEAGATSGVGGELVEALAARAALLAEPGLAAEAARHGASRDRLEAVPATSGRRAPPGPAVEAPTPPRGDWTARLGALKGLDPRAVGGEADRALLEAAGARARAARAWRRAAEPAALLQAWRLREALGPEERDALRAALRERVPDDELALAGSPEACALACALWHELPGDAERRRLAIRLRGAGVEAVARDLDEPVEGDEDAHDPGRRLAAAEAEEAAGRTEAAAAIAAALLRRLREPELEPRLHALVRRLLARDEPPEELRRAVARALVRDEPWSDALAEALGTSPRAAHPLHGELWETATDASRSEAGRVARMAAWLRIWTATATPPETRLLAPLVREAPLLVALAAYRAAGTDEPVDAALELLEAHPPERTTVGTWAELLVDAPGRGTAP